MEPKTKYMISGDTLDSSSFRIPINKADFDNLKNSRNKLSTARKLEVRYEMILSNYIAMEKGLFSMMIDYHLVKELYWKNSLDELYNDVVKDEIQVNTLLSNLLTVAISYRDHVEYNIKKLFGVPKDQIDKIFYKPESGYEFIRKLRNHQQHQNILHNTFFHNSKRAQNDNQEKYLEILSNVLLNVDLSRGKRGKNLLSLIPPNLKSKLNERKQLDVRYIIRLCMDLHNEIHREITDAIKLDVQKARDCIEESTNYCIGEFQKKSPKILEEYLKTNLCAYAYTPKIPVDLLKDSHITIQAHGDLNISERIPLLLKWDDVRCKLNNKNQQSLRLLEKQFKII